MIYFSPSILKFPIIFLIFTVTLTIFSPPSSSISSSFHYCFYFYFSLLPLIMTTHIHMKIPSRDAKSLSAIRWAASALTQSIIQPLTHLLSTSTSTSTFTSFPASNRTTMRAHTGTGVGAEVSSAMERVRRYFCLAPVPLSLT